MCLAPTVAFEARMSTQEAADLPSQMYEVLEICFQGHWEATVMIYNGGRSEEGGNEMTMHLCWETEGIWSSWPPRLLCPKAVW